MLSRACEQRSNSGRRKGVTSRGEMEYPNGETRIRSSQFRAPETRNHLLKLGEGLGAGGSVDQLAGCTKACLHRCHKGVDAALELRGLSEETGKGANLSGHEGDVLRDDIGGSGDPNYVADSAVIVPDKGQGVAARVVSGGIDLALRQCSRVELLRLEEGG